MVRKIADLRTEGRALAKDMQTATNKDIQLFTLQAFCAKISAGLEEANFSARRQIIQLPYLHGRTPPEGAEKVVYLKYLIDLLEQRPRLHTPILPSSNSRDVNTISLTRRAVIAGPPV